MVKLSDMHNESPPVIPVGEVVGMIEELLSIDRHKEIERYAAKLNMTYDQYRRWYNMEHGRPPFPTPDCQSLQQIRRKLSEWRSSLRTVETGFLKVESDVPLPNFNFGKTKPKSGWKKLASEMKNVGDSMVVCGWNEATALKAALHSCWGKGSSVSRKIGEGESSVEFPVRVWRTK